MAPWEIVGNKHLKVIRIAIFVFALYTKNVT